MKLIKYFYLLLSFYLLSNHLFAQLLIPYNKNGKFGFVDAKKNVIIPLQYEEVMPFVEDSNRIINKKIMLANVKLNGKWGIINEKNQIIVPIRFEENLQWIKEHNVFTVQSYNFEKKNKNFFQLLDATGKELLRLKGTVDWRGFEQNGIAYVALDDKVGVINAKGKILIPFQYDMWSPVTEYCYSEGLFGFCKNEKFGFVNEKNEVVVPFKFELYPQITTCFENGKARVMFENEIVLIDKKGKIIEKVKHLSNPDFSSNHSFEITMNAKDYSLPTFVFLDKKTKQQVLPDTFTFIAPDVDANLFIVQKEGEFGILDGNLKYIYPLTLTESPVKYTIKNEKKHLWLIQKDEKKGLIDSLGKIIIPLEYDEIFENLSEKNPVIAKKNGKYVWINYQNKILKTYNLNKIEKSYLNKNFITTNSKELQGAIAETTGEEIIPAKWKRVQNFGNVFLVLDDNNQQTLVDEKGNFTNLVFDNHAYVGYYPLGEDYARVAQNGKTGVLDKMGKLIIDCQYEDILHNYVYDLSKKTNHKALFTIKEKGLLGISNTEKILIQPKYTEMTVQEFYINNIYHVFFFVKKGKKQGFVDLEGNEYFE